MKTFKIALCLPMVALIPLSAQADPQPDPAAFTAHVKKKPHAKKVAQPRYVPPPAPYPVVAAIPAYAPHAYDWSGIYVGVFAGVAGDSNNPVFSVPTNGALQGNGIGFLPSAQYNSNGVSSVPYSSLANPTGSTGTTYNNNGFYTSAGNSGMGGTYNVNGTGGQNYNYPTSVASTVINPYQNQNGNTTYSQFTANNQSSRLLAAIGGEIGYRKQFGNFVIGVEADGGFVDGKRSQDSTSSGQFSNTLGIRTSVNGQGTNGDPAVQVPLTAGGSVNVENNGNSNFSQHISAGPQWLGTARLTAGFAVDRLLVYATGGLAYGEANIAASAAYNDTATSTCSGVSSANNANAGNVAANFQCNGFTQNSSAQSSFTYTDAAQWSGSNSKVLTGFTVGTGAAYAVTENIIFKLEGYYYNLGTISTTAYGTGTQTLATTNAPSAGTPGTQAISVTPYSASRKIDGFIAKVGVQFKFNTSTPETIVAKY